jgi:hypothetical protein
VLGQNFGDAGFEGTQILRGGGAILASGFCNRLLQGTTLISSSSGDDAIAVLAGQ